MEYKKPFEIENTEMQIIRTELDYNPNIREYAETYEKHKILYTTMLTCIIIILLIIAGM